MKTFIVIKQIEAETEADAFLQLAEEIDQKLDLHSVFKLNAVHSTKP